MNANALERVERARNMPLQLDTLQSQIQSANQKIARLEKEMAAMSKALKKHLQQQPQQGQSLLSRLLGQQ